MMSTKTKNRIGAFIIALVVLNMTIDIVYDKIIGNSSISFTYGEPTITMKKSDYKEEGRIIMSKLSNGTADSVDLPEAVEGAGELAATFLKMNYLRMEAILSTKDDLEIVSEGLTNQITKDVKNGVTYEDYRESFFTAVKNKVSSEE